MTDTVYKAHYLVQCGHGGSCCGMSHIRNFCNPPGKFMAVYDGVSHHPDLLGYSRGYAPAPLTQKGELLFHVQSIESVRPKGIIEVVLKGSQKTLWHDTLLEVGFKEVNSNVNSNTGNTITVYHRNSGTVPKVTRADLEACEYQPPKKVETPPKVEASVREAVAKATRAPRSPAAQARSRRRRLFA